MGSFTDYLLDSIEWVRSHEWLGVLWIVGLYSFTCVFFLPGSILTLAAGAIYGFWIGTLIMTVASTAGAAVSFLISRYLARDWVQRKLGRGGRLRTLEHAVGSGGWKIILISRISPIVPHSLVSYAAGLTQISFWRFCFASLGGFLPLNAAYAYAGALVGTALRSNHSLAPQDPVSWAFYIAGMVATLAAVILVARAATRAWKETIRKEEAAADSEPAV